MDLWARQGNTGWYKLREQHWHICTIMCKISSWQEAATSCMQHRESASVLCDDVDGWDGHGVGGRLKAGNICILIADSHCHKQQKPTQHCKAVILQLKINFKNKSLLSNTKPAFPCSVLSASHSQKSVLMIRKKLLDGSETWTSLSSMPLSLSMTFLSPLRCLKSHRHSNTMSSEGGQHVCLELPLLSASRLCSSSLSWLLATSPVAPHLQQQCITAH